jgi:hypothetical protein
MAKVRTFTLEQIQEADEEYGGFCIACGEQAFSVEPDARCYECESCGEKRVYGAQEIAVMGLVS